MRPRRGGGDACGRDETFPEALRHRDGAKGGQLLAGVLIPDDGEFLEERIAGVRRDPVDLNGELVTGFGEATRAPSRKLEDRRAAEAPVGHENRSVGLELRAGSGDHDVLYGDTRKVGESGVLDVEGEEGRDRRDDGVPEGFRDGQAARGFVATRRDD